jgi:hypothetical protein
VSFSNIFYFQIVPRRSRAEHLVPTIRRCSKQFRAALAVGDVRKMEESSKAAWDAMVNLFEILRGEQDDGNLANGPMSVSTAVIVNQVSATEQQDMISAGKIDRVHASFGCLSLQDTLNKIAHYNISTATFRVDGRGSHYLLLGGKYQGKHWVAEILVSRLCKNAAAAVRAITGP